MSSLLAAGVSVDAQDDNGWTSLHFAAQEGRASVVRVLLRSSANPHLVDRHGNGPLWTAVMNAGGDTRIVELLLTHGAHSERKNLHGLSLLNIPSAIGGELERLFNQRPALPEGEPVSPMASGVHRQLQGRQPRYHYRSAYY